uniref:Uncharacterized protein n=1 Tax=Amphimedon queenslandica TaxID=400682 RepID=A0A1X7V0S6_AMPQE
MERYKEFGLWINSCFNAQPVIKTSGKGKIIRLSSTAGQPFRFNNIVIQEDQTNGQVITQFSVYNPMYNGTVSIYNGTSIGHKIIIHLTDDLWPSHELVLNITQAAVVEPAIINFAAYSCHA